VRVDIPDRAMVVLVGPAGSGKSTFAAQHFGSGEIVSSDAIRERLTGDPSDQSRNKVVFRILDAEVAALLRMGGSAVVDATSVERHARRALIRVAERAQAPAVAIVLALPLAVVLARNAHRQGRPVPDDVVRRQWHTLERSLRDGVLETEGFAAVHVLGDARTIDATRIIGRPRR
jgi:protein phosphatase